MEITMPIEVPLWLNRSELSDKVAIIDDEDYDKVMSAISESAKWYYRCMNQSSFNEYAVNGDRRKSIHRVVIDAPKGMDVDHINGNGLDNRKENLRICTRSENMMNQKLKSHSASGCKGVQYTPTHRQKYTSKKTGITTIKEYKLKNPYRAYVGDGKGGHIKLGRYATREEAARVRDKKALELHGEFVYLNFPELLEEYMAELDV
tara:strand:+ start:504 stop:1118 length:615 start_codon:yes stop_codon:yes gene_type:complete